MYKFKSLEDTVVAIATATGHAGIGIVRLSGKNAVAIADKMFESKTGKKPSQFKSHTVHHGWIRQNNAILDEVLLTVMRSPRSYTKEDVIEISCHGGFVSVRSILKCALELGARLAEPGEFTKRAFLNGRIDLTQAEAVLDLINSKTEAFLRVSTNQLKGDLSRILEEIREELMNTYVEIEAIVNFPEDEIEAEGIKKISKNIEDAKKRIETLLESSEHGRLLKEGMKIVLCGKPNVGKSSLLNTFLKQPRAIVSEIAGTTRDTIEEMAQIKGIPFQLIDTAGFLDPRDLIEEEAMKRSHMSIESADLVLLVLDANTNINSEDEKLMQLVKDQNTIAVINKNDLDQNIEEKKVYQMFPEKRVKKISATKRAGIDELESTIVENVWHSKSMDTHGILISNLRHIQSLKDASLSLTNALKILNDQMSLEFVSEEIKAGVNCLDEVTGKNIDNDLLDSIFSQFCIGK